MITTYAPLPISFSHGQGIWLYDAQGRAYLDALSGIGVCGLGHAHPAVTKTICDQAAKLLHVSNTYQISQQTALAGVLCNLAKMRQAFFANSGTEANEAALKLIRLFGQKKKVRRPKVIVMDRGFHGRTMACLSASSNKQIQKGYAPLMGGFLRIPFNQIEPMAYLAQSRDDIVAVILEPIQGEGGVHVADTAYLEAVATLCQQKDWLLMLDEVQTGNGRTGHFFAYQKTTIQPDLITTAKGLANGIPIGACLIGEKAADLFQVGSHGSTFGGNPLACQTALTVIDCILKDKLCEHAAQMGTYLCDQLARALPRQAVRAIRGAGLMIGIELHAAVDGLRERGLAQGLLFSVTAKNTIRLLPPLIITKVDCDELVARLAKSLWIS